MKLVVQVRLMPTADQALALAETLQACNAAADHAARVAFSSGQVRAFELQKLVYSELKARYGLSAQPAIRVIKKVADAYAALGANLRQGRFGLPGSRRRVRIERAPITFRTHAAQPFDDRCLSWNWDTRTISIWTVLGRKKGVVFAGAAAQLGMLASSRRGESDLLFRDGKWFLIATCEVREPVINTAPRAWLGVDLGIANLATTSDGIRHAGRRLNHYRRKQRFLRDKLQAKNTNSARRRLKARRRKESRFARIINHTIAKQIVTEAQRTARGIALEELTGIRDRVRLRKPQRVTIHSWSFADLGTFISYKARRAGVPVVYVNPAYTSQTCAACGYRDRGNRISQSQFVCRSCGVVAHADRNAACNIAARAAISQVVVGSP